MLQNIAISISSLVAITSLIFSIKAYRQKKPKLQIIIPNEQCDCFFGATKRDNYDSILKLPE
jgi:hypothetical protein